MKFAILYFAVITAWFASCSDKKKTTGKDLMPEMLQTDSVQIIYFQSPDEPRYFTYVSVNDASFISSLVKDVTEETRPENPCRKEGKIYCYKKGEVFNTIFFAYLDDQCTFLRYIKNGNLYYFQMSSEVKKELDRYKALAIEPAAAQ